MRLDSALALLFGALAYIYHEVSVVTAMAGATATVIGVMLLFNAVTRGLHDGVDDLGCR